MNEMCEYNNTNEVKSDSYGDSVSLAMKDMQRSREKLRKAQLLAGIGSFEYLPEEKLIVLSDEARACLGIADDVNILEVDDFCKDIKMGVGNHFCSMIENLQGSSPNSHIEFMYKPLGAMEKYIEVILDEPGSTIKGAIHGVFRDITKTRKAEIARSVNAQAFEAVFYNSKIAILVLNLKGNVIDFNNSALDLLGYSAEELKKLHSVNLLLKEDVLEASKIFAKFINSAGRVNSLDYRVVDKNGMVIDVLVNFEMVIGAEGEKIYVFLNDIRGIRDMEKKHLDQERMLIQQSKMATLGEMVGLIAHQWQQPLNSIAMIVQMLEDLIEVDENNSKMLNKSIESVMAQVEFMSSTMSDFRNFLKPSDKKSNFTIFNIIEDVVQLYRPQLRHFDILCDVFYERDEVKKMQISGYATELKNVILNFLTNSRDAIEEKKVKGYIKVYVSEADGVLSICIEDNGGGIPESIMEKIFDPYVSTKGDKGTGLGLYMTKLIVRDRMGGDIILTNTKEGLRICLKLKKV